MSENGKQTATVVGIVAAAVLTTASIVYGATARSAEVRVERGLQQEVRINALEAKSAARDEQYKAISITLAEIKEMLRDHVKDGR